MQARIALKVQAIMGFLHTSARKRNLKRGSRLFKENHDAEIRRPRHLGRGFESRCQTGLHRPHPHPGASHPAGACRPRRVRRSGHWHGQNRGLPFAHHEHACPCRAGQKGRHRPAHAGGNPHPRTCRADRRGLPRHLARNRPLRCRALRRHQIRPADNQAAQGRRHHHRHARAPHRPARARRGQPARHRRFGYRRGRPHARHGLLAFDGNHHRRDTPMRAKRFCSRPRSTAR